MEKAQLNKSINTVRTEIEYLRDSNLLTPPQFDSIMAQLPQPGAMGPSQYVDLQFAHGPGGPPPQYNQQVQQVPAQIAMQAQDPNNPANPQHPKHHEWAKSLGQKFGGAFVFGAGATAGADMVNSIFR